MAVIRNAVEIHRSPAQVFDHLSDPRNELEWNPKVEKMEKITDGQLNIELSTTGDPATLLTSRFEAHPHGTFRLIFPIFLIMMRREEARNMQLLRQALESQ